MRLFVLLAVVQQWADAGVCEELQIPMETVKIPGMGYVCKVRECEELERSSDGRRSCVTCNQDGHRDPLNIGSEFCPLAVGKCEKGKCVPRTDTNYFEENFGKKWKGLNTFNAVTVTHYGGSTAGGCYGDKCDLVAIEPCFKKLGIDGLAAVPTQMYGSDATSGQGLFKRNNLCYKLVGVDGISRVVAVYDKCMGYGQCSKGDGPIVDISTVYDFPKIDTAAGADIWADVNQCIRSPNSRVYAGLGQRCWYFTDGSDAKPKACCEGKCGGGALQVDWCASQSHAHFDLTPDLLDLLCDAGGGGGKQRGSCQLQWVEPVKCPVWPKPGKCCAGPCSENCEPKEGACGDNATQCSACGGSFCEGDDWHNVCDAKPDQIPSPYPGWTTNPPDPPKPYSPGDRTPSPPPADDADTPTTWPGTTKKPVTTIPGQNPTKAPSGGGDSTPANQPTTTYPGEVTTTYPGEPTTTYPGEPTTTYPGEPTTTFAGETNADDHAGNNVAVIAGAATGVIAVLAAAAFGATKLRQSPQLEGDFEQADDAEEGEQADREGVVQQGSEDFA